jgi:SAM-dependent methyltransferase
VTVALFRAGRLFARVHRTFNHLSAGTLRLDDLRTGIERSWEHFEARDSSVEAGLVAWEEDLLASFVDPAADDVLLVGSGPGRDLVAMVARGYRVSAVEPARRANATARRHLAKHGLSADIIEGFFEDVDLPRSYDVIIFSNCCYSFIPQSGRRIDALRKAVEHLRPGGRIVITYMIQQSGHPAWMRVARMAATISRSDWRPERGDVVHSVDTEHPLFHYEHPFTPGEIDGEAKAAGLRVLDRREIVDNPAVVLVRA